MTCPECGATFTPGRPNQRFCTVAHKLNFHRVMTVRGQALMPLALTWRKHRKPTTPDSRYAFAELCALLDLHAAEDRAVGRNVDLIVSAKRAAGWAAVDLVA